MSILTYIHESLEDKKKEEGLSVLDKALNGDIEDIKEFEKSLRPNGPCIYAFITDKVNNAIKIGYTDQHPLKRIEQWKEVYGKEEGEVECLGYWSSEEIDQSGQKVFFWDHAVHDKVTKKGYANVNRDEFYKMLSEKGKKINDVHEIHYSKEFFKKYKSLLQGQLSDEDKVELSKELIEDILIEMKKSIKNGTSDFKLYKFDSSGKTSSQKADIVWGSPKGYPNTDLQEDCIKKGVEAIKNGKKNILMAAVMRFGKTHATYEIIKGTGLKKVVVVSAKADVRKAWRDDINHKDFYKDFVFVEVLDEFNWDITSLGSDGKLVTKHERIYENTDIFDTYENKTIILFFTLYDLSGSLNKVKAKHRKIFDEEYDMLVVDETHYGSHANSFGKVTKLNKNIEVEDNADFEEEEKTAKEMESFKKSLNIKYKTILQVSGTPYYILASNEMIEDDAEVISKVSYTDMLNARDEWEKDHPNEPKSNSPYYGVPTLHKIGLRLTKDCRRAIKKSNTTDSLTALFEVKSGRFRYEKEITGLIRSLFGDDKEDTFAFLKNKSVDGNKVCKHTIMVLPRVEACKAMENLLHEMKISRDIIRVVDKEGKANKIDIGSLNNRLLEDDNKNIKSIVLTVNRYLTGVSMPLIDSMIYLKNASSPQEYDQNIFRLCTRNVKKVSKGDNEEGPEYVNMKDNVYLIDFNISNMFNMLANSAKMRALADAKDDKNVNIMDRISEYMKEDLRSIPLYCEDGKSKEITGKMKVINSNDLMEIYANYNKDKSIADIATDEIDLFDGLFKDRKFQTVIQKINIQADKGKINGLDKINPEGEDTINIENINISPSIINKLPERKLQEIIDKINNTENNDDVTIDGIKSNGETSINIDNDNKKVFKDYLLNELIKRRLQKITKEKFISIVKGILYCNITLDNPYTDIKSMIDDSKNDDDLREALKDFKISVDDIEKVYDIMSPTYKEAFDYLLLKISYLAHEIKEKGSDALDKAMRGLDKIDKSEVVTPPEIVNKMIDKLDESDYKNAESILLVNEKSGEFFKGLIRKFGKEIGKKCKIVCSSTVGERLTKKMLKTEGFNDYINNIIMSIDDINGDGKYTVNDFLEMNNKEVLKENGGKKFDIVLMNPPYDKSLHLKFLEKTIKIADNVISIQPIDFLIAQDYEINEKSKANIWKDLIKHINSVQRITQNDSNELFNIDQFTELGIIYSTNKNENNNHDFIKELGITDFRDILKKIKNYKDNFKNHRGKNLEKYFVPIYKNIRVGYAITHGAKGTILFSDKGIIAKRGFTKESIEYHGRGLFINFDSQEEANNFKEYCKTDLIRSIGYIIVFCGLHDSSIIPFMPNYKKQWNDRDIANEIGLSDSEIELIINTFKKIFIR